MSPENSSGERELSPEEKKQRMINIIKLEIEDIFKLSELSEEEKKETSLRDNIRQKIGEIIIKLDVPDVFFSNDQIENIINSRIPLEISVETEEIKEIKQSVVEKFAKLNITRENLESVEGFNQLSEGQQLLVCENLSQLALGKIKEEARGKFHKEIQESGFWGRIWKGITKNYQITKAEKAGSEEIQKGGMQIHEEILKQLVKGMEEFGPEVEIKDNNLEIQYVLMSDFENLTQAQKMQINSFNFLATKFSKMPYEWSLETANKKEKKQYQELKGRYNLARENILILKEEKSNDKEACLFLNDIEGKIKMNQFLNAHPEIEKQLKNIDDKNVWLSALKNVITERGVYFGFGFTARSVAVGFLGFAAAPLVAAGLGGWMARRRAGETLKEKELLARKGVKDTSKEAKNFINADKSAEKLNDLIIKIDSEDNTEKKQKLINSLKVRIDYTKSKIDQGLINFGNENERLKNQYDLINTLSKARIGIEINNEERKSELEERLENFLNIRKQRISKEQSYFLLKKTLTGAGISATTAFAGVLFRHFLSEWWTGKQIEELGLAGEVKKQMKDVFGSAVDLKEEKLLKILNKSLENIKDESQRGKITLGLIQDKELTADDIKFVDDFKKILKILTVDGFTPEEQGKILAGLSYKGLDSADSQDFQILNKDLNTLGVKDKMGFILKTIKGDITIDEKHNISSAITYFNIIKDQSSNLAKALIEKITGDNQISDAEINYLKLFSERNLEELNTLGSNPEFIETVKGKELLKILEKVDEILHPQQNVLENLEGKEGINIVKDVNGKIISGEIEIRKGKTYEYLDQALRQVVGGQTPDIVEGKIFAEHLGKIENNLANLRNLITGKYNEIAGVNASEVKEAIEFDGDKLIIKSPEKLNGIVERLYKHSEKVVTPESDASAFAGKTSENIWENKILPKGTKITDYDEIAEKAKHIHEVQHPIYHLYHSEEEIIIPKEETSVVTPEEVAKEIPLPDEEIKARLGEKGISYSTDEHLFLGKKPPVAPTEETSPTPETSAKQATPDIKESIPLGEPIKPIHPLQEAMQQPLVEQQIPTDQRIIDWTIFSNPQKEAIESVINIKDGMSLEEKNILDFLVSHKGSDESFFTAIRAVEIVKDNYCNISYQNAYDYLPQLDNVSGNAGIMEGVVEFLKGNGKTGLGKIFNIEADEIKNYTLNKNGIHRISLKNGFDYVVEILKNNKINIGVDGPRGFNWELKGGLFGLGSHPIKELTTDNIGVAKGEMKRFIEILK